MPNELRLSRRMFVAWVGGASAGFYLFGRLPGMSAPVALAAIPGGSLDPLLVPKYETPLLIPPVMPKADTIVRRGQTVDYYEISMKQFEQQILPAPPTSDNGLGLRCCEVGELERLAPPQRSVAHDRSAGEPAGAGEVDQRPQGCGRGLPAASAPGRPDAALGQPAGRRQGPRHPTYLHGHTQPVHRSRADSHPRSRRRGRGRRQRRLRGGVVPACGQEHPSGLRQERHLVPLLRSQGGRVLWRWLAARLRRLPVSEREPGLDDLVPRPRARHDAPQRLRRPGGLLHRPRRAGRRRRCAGLAIRVEGRAARPRTCGGRPAQQDLLRDADRDPGPLVQQRRVTLLSRLAGVLRRRHRGGSGLHPGHRSLTDLESRVLREHDHGQRQHVAVPPESSSAVTASAS